MTETKTYFDLWHSVTYFPNPESYLVKFSVREIESMQGSDETGWSVGDLSDEIIVGYLKFDGCMNIEFKDYIHFCNIDNAVRFGKLFERIYQDANELITNQ